MCCSLYNFFSAFLFFFSEHTMADQETRPAVATPEAETKPTTTEPTVDATAPAENESKSANATGDEPITTVFHDRLNYNVKHPLHNTWTLWFDNPGKKANAQSWSQNLKEIVSVDTVEDFWGVYNNIVKVNHLDVSSNYHIFKKGIRPEWEDAANANGGKFSIQLPRNRTGEAINDYWLYTILAMIGEQFAYEDQICGAVVSVRKVFYRIAVWIKSSDDNEIIEKLGRQLKEFLSVPNNIPVEFTPHGDHGPAKGANKITI
ncbi:translation initiation factor eIF 4e-like domain-containing protein [Radiomyces spectabilis]|uniref:translation initiation factor eIF 4e-like domain-containing protein n=1 Tax=Radiomyces spectabilis TaxID=64574 RepID=UPI00221F8F6C|nr:translation initiation factor eIF 4e-like domain-containing protein [Radiomyces spectabilis]KAI8379154.1 translation initiation factor eIF 4e-like domain-containing protein [Radiomyces spectabilis]